MWNIPYIESPLNSGWTLEKRVQVYSTGESFETYTGYTGIKLSFIQDMRGQTVSNNGNYVKYSAQAMIAANSVTGITIEEQNTFLKNTIYGDFKVVAVEDFSRNPRFGIYYAYLRRDEIA
jgi:hypothetical protein